MSHTLELLALASPMALAMAAPLPYLTALAGSVARGGVVIKSPLALERLGRVQVGGCGGIGFMQYRRE